MSAAYIFGIIYIVAAYIAGAFLLVTNENRYDHSAGYLVIEGIVFSISPISVPVLSAFVAGILISEKFFRSKK